MFVSIMNNILLSLEVSKIVQKNVFYERNMFNFSVLFIFFKLSFTFLR